MPEIVGEAAHFVNPLDTAEIADAMMRFATDENFRNSFIAKGLEQAKKFDWDKAARETLAVYESFKK